MMRVDFLSPNADRAGRYTVRFSNGSTLRLYRQTVQDFGLYSGMEIADKDYQKLVTAAGEMSAKMRAVRIVSASSVSQKDLEQRLIHKGEDPDQAKKAVAWMADLQLVDDGKTAEQIVDRCIRNGLGLARAKQALYEKRIPKELWDAVLADYPDQSDKIQNYLESRLDAQSDRREIKRAVDALIRRGHPYSIVKRCLERLSFDTEAFPEE